MKKNNSTKVWLAAIIVTLTFSSKLTAQYNYNWQTDGTVNATVIDNNVLYIGGTFSYVGRYMGNAVAMDLVTGSWDAGWPIVNSDVNSVLPDGNGGWFIGGIFTKIGGVNRNGIAHLKADKSVDANWNANMSGTFNVTTIAISGGTLYIGGGFSNAGGQPRNNIAALDINTGNATAWDPNANSIVTTIAVSGSTVYVGGHFTAIGGQARNKIAALNAALNTNNALMWDPSPLGSGAPYIATIAVSGSTVYVGGSFTTIGGQTRNNIAELDALTGMATPWDPNANTDVLVIKISGSIVYAGGHFSIIGGQTRRKIAALDASINSNNALPWNPNANDFIIDITISGNTIYVGGAFTTIGGQVRRKVAALDATINTNNALSWNPNAGNGWNVGALAVSGSSVLVGGNFTSINGEFRNNIAAIDLVSNTLLPWNPNANGNINTITIAGNTVYVGGDFTAIGGLPRNRIAALDLTVNTNNALAWNPNANNTIRTLAVSGNVVYAGGDFTHIGGLPRNRIAALDATMAANNVLPGWNPDANNIVRTLLVSGSIIYAGGDFTTMGVQNRNRIAAIDAAGTVTAWNPNANNIVRTLAEYGGTVYAGGDFLNIGGQLRARIAALDVAGNATAWSPNANNTVRALAIDGGILYAAGDFGFMGGETRRNKAAFDLVANTNSAISSWDPIPEGCFTLNCIDVSGYLGYIGGNFTAGGGGRSFFLSAIPSLSQILPVQLKEFKLTKESNNCIVQWTVTNATEKIKFELQRSSAGNDFISIAERETNNTSDEYRFTVNDNNLTPGIYYYRIKTIQESGETNYSDTRSLVISGAPVDVYPTRIHGDNLNIVLKEKNYSFQLINSAGILMMHQPLIQGINNIDTRKLPAGIYFYIIRNKNQQPEKSGKILVQ